MMLNELFEYVVRIVVGLVVSILIVKAMHVPQPEETIEEIEERELEDWNVEMSGIYGKYWTYCGKCGLIIYSEIEWNFKIQCIKHVC